jgi:superfamily II DNA/RNA helicase
LDKDEVVARILQAEGREKVVIFTRTKRSASKVTEELTDRGFSATSVHGDMSQEARERSMAAFKAGKKDILIATDVAARGIDVDDVTHVINYTVPEDDKAYLHRVGRTGRAGRTGVAVTFVDWEDMHKWHLIARALDMPLEPAETYSSSPHLFTDLNIPAGTKGRLNSTPIPRAEKAAGRGPSERRDSREPREPRGDSAISKPAGSGRTRERRRRPSGGAAPTA